MLEFRTIDISDRERINKALRYSDFRGCEYSFANNLAWRRLSDTLIAFHGDFYICGAPKPENGKPFFLFPSGEGDIRSVIGELRRISEEANAPLCFVNVTDELVEMLGELYPEQFTAEPDRDGADYIYSTSDLINLPGKRYHAKRNHLARFRESGCSYSPITDNDFDDCISFCTESYNKNSGSGGHSIVAEQYAINTYFSYYHELGLSGGVIRKDDRIAALTIGEPINSDTFGIHIEKADTSIQGIYAGINNCFASDAAAGFRFINREEDLGLEGLRKAKLSYHPAFLLNKNVVIFK